MARNHCIPENCATVWYEQNIKTSFYEYTYPGEQPGLIEATRYELTEIIECPIPHEELPGELAYTSGGKGDFTVNGFGFQTGQRYIFDVYRVELLFVDNDEMPGFTETSRLFGLTDDCSLVEFKPSPNDDEWFLFPSTTRNASYSNSGWILKFYLEEELIFERISDDQPSVTKTNAPGKGVIWNRIKVEKLSYLEKVEVVDFHYNTIPPFGTVNPVDPHGEIPRHCLNIYRTIYPLHLIFRGFNNPTNAAQFKFIKQICSTDPGSLTPPRYVVVCDCEEFPKCPPGTCEIDCGDFICCYGEDGKSILRISKEK